MRSPKPTLSCATEVARAVLPRLVRSGTRLHGLDRRRRRCQTVDVAIVEVGGRHRLLLGVDGVIVQVHRGGLR